MKEIEQLQEWIDKSRRIVFFGGAGVSTESGIPDFRSTDGLYNQKYKYPPETMLSHTMYERHTEEFYEFYRDKLLYPDAKPNAAHRKLAELERAGKLSAIVTQNICTRRREAAWCTSCTAPCCAITAANAISSTISTSSSTVRVCRTAAAGAS